jgi:carotenoid cleavage dioxygenase
MPSTAEQPAHRREGRPVTDETTIGNLHVDGVLPAALSGRYVCIGPNLIGATPGVVRAGAAEAMVHAVTVRAGRGVGYRNRWVVTDTAARKLGTEPVPGPRNGGPDAVTANVVHFGGAVLALGDGSLAYELGPDLETRRRVDLAGASRGLHPNPKLDPLTGDLHLLAHDTPTAPVHVVVPANGLTRTVRPLDDAPGPVRDLAPTRDHLVALSDRHIGVGPRSGRGRLLWCPAPAEGHHIVNAHDVGGAVVVDIAGPSLERWTVRPGAAIDRQVIDPGCTRSARIDERWLGGPQRLVWTVAGGVARRHDLVAGTTRHHEFGPGRCPGELVFVARPERPHGEGAGWLVGFVHDDTSDRTDLVVIGAELDRPPIAAVRIPRRVPGGGHGTWAPSTP